jgi:dipeptidyl aminopeptidase/acylaminoacyl peptidase
MDILESTAGLTGLLFLVVVLPTAWAQKPPLTLHEFFSAVDIRAVQISPDGHAVVIETRRPDWAANRFRNDLWLYRDDPGGSLVQLTQSGHDSSPQWSPDGRWIAFLSDRKTAAGEARTSGDPGTDTTAKDVAQVYVISPYGGEALPVTFSAEEIHAFSWSEGSLRLYFATRNPWTKAEKDSYAEEWKDVLRFREADRGDTLFSVDVASLVAKNQSRIGEPAGAPAPEKLTATPYSVSQMAASPDGRLLAIGTHSPAGRFETHQPYGIYVLDLAAGTSHLAIHTQEEVDALHWAPDSRHIFFTYDGGAPEGPYQDVQFRLYWVNQAGGQAVRWASRFTGELPRLTQAYAVVRGGGVFAAGQLGTEVQPYFQSSPDAEFVKQPGWAGTYAMISAARNSSRVAFVYSSLQRPREVYLAESPERLEQARPITAFNQIFTERELPQGKSYHWTADDGTPIEGMLIYPPGKFEAKRSPTLTMIHGGPYLAEGNEFPRPFHWAWAALAATQGWLVFLPNYRGSSGYGDKFILDTVPHDLSRSGRDVLEGVEALVKDGIADPDQLTVGGYSYGGFLTNWLITQTTRFKAAVTGAGGVEAVAQWGNDVAPLDDAYLLGGAPWEAEANYNAEAAIWQIGKVTTPTHIVTGSEDALVPTLEAYLLERALQTRGVPHTLLIFPGEGHILDRDPWHREIKVREELKWLEKYGHKKE